MFDIDPNKLILFTAIGDGNIDVTFPPTEVRPFGRFLVAFIRCHFSDIKSTALSPGVLNPMTIHVDSQPEQSTIGPFDAELFEMGEYGFGHDLSATVEREEIPQMVIRQGWGQRVAWTNPQSGDIAWGLEYGILPLLTPGGSA